MEEIPPKLSIEFEAARQKASERLSVGDAPDGLPDFHRLTIDELKTRFGLTNSDDGLTSGQAAGNLQVYRKNVIIPKKANPFWTLLSYVFGGFNAFLWLCALLCFIAWRPLGSLVCPQCIIVLSFDLLSR